MSKAKLTRIALVLMLLMGLLGTGHAMADGHPGNNVTGPVLIQSNGITLDGDCFTISGGDHGVLVSGKIGITLTDLNNSGNIWGAQFVGYSGDTISKSRTIGANFGVMGNDSDDTITSLTQSAKTGGHHKYRDK